MVIRGFVLTLEIRSDIFSLYKADIDISSYEKYFKLNFDFFSPALQKNVSEYLVPTGLYRKAFRSLVENVIIFMDLNFSPKTDVERLLSFFKGSEYAIYPSETEFRLSHSEVPILI